MNYEEKIPAQNRVFVNRTLNMNHVKLVGFDMDYTVVTYNVPAFEEAAYNIVTKKLVENHNYPAEVLNFTFNPDFVIRGLVIDVDRGNILKVNRYGYVKRATHGTAFLSFDEQKKIYSSIAIDWSDPRYYIIHTLFSLGEGCLFAQLVDLFDRLNKPVDLRKVFADIRRGMDDAHQEGSLKGQVIQNPEKFLIRNKTLVEALKKFKRFGKKLALITNSDYDYSRIVMDYCFSPFMEIPWQDLFDIIVVGANKPVFFLHTPKFLKVDRESGGLSNFHEPLKWGNIYQGGNARHFERDLKLSGADILYIGDHIYGDVVTLKEAIGWRTGLVVQELEQEVPALEKSTENLRDLLKKMEEKEALENELYTIREANPPREDRKRNPVVEKQKEGLKHQISKLDEQLTEIIAIDQKNFNPLWGEVMRAGNEESRFATLVERYACVYMASVGNLNYYSPFKYFRPKRRFLAHDPNPYTFSDTGTVEETELHSPE